MSKWKGIIIHCTDSDFGSRELLHQWHVVENKWQDIGYHFGILNGRMTSLLTLPAMDGMVESYRPLSLSGAHAQGYNDTHLGVVLVGKKKFSQAQKESLRKLIYDLCMEFDIDYSNVIGHCAVSPKSCPNFDVQEFVESLKKV